jgi:hypothetical protein
MVNEADIDIVDATSSTLKGGLKRKSDSVGLSSPKPPPNERKPGHIPKDVIVPHTFSDTPPSSPIPWMIEETKSQVAVTAPAAA